MDEQTHLLKIVTSKTKESIEQLEIVTPTLFNAIFTEFANTHKLILEDEHALAQTLLEEECTALTKLQSQTSKNVLLLSDSASKAITAIEKKDDTQLSKVLEETQKLKEEIETLKESVYKDMLTNTYNRKWLHDNIIDAETNTSKTSGILALIDLNYFKYINDTHGHLIGDKVLIFIANEFLKLGYPVVRYGGDEFIIIFDANISDISASTILSKLREKVLKKKLKSNSNSFTLSFSYGLHRFSTGDLCTQILENADTKMYEDKHKIKSRITGI